MILNLGNSLAEIPYYDSDYAYSAQLTCLILSSYKYTFQSLKNNLQFI